MGKLPRQLTVGQRFFRTDFSHRADRSRVNAHCITEYLKTVRGIEVFEDFPVQLLSTHQQNYGNVFYISTRTIDAIVDTCELISEYVYDINELICHEILSMAKIHTCVISKKYLSNQLIRLKGSMPEHFQATVHKNGVVHITDSY